MSKKVIHLLCSDADRAALQPVLDALKTRGLHVSEETPRKKNLVLAALSERFYADDSKTKALLDLVAAGAENVLPLQLDSASIPDVLKNALYSRNIIPASKRDAAHTAERIVDALPKRKSKLPLILTAAAIVMIAVVALLLWQANLPTVEEAVPVVAEPVEEIYIPAGLTEEDLAEVRCVVIVGEHLKTYTKEDKEPRDDMSGEWRDMLFEVASSRQRDGTDEFEWYWNEDGSQVSLTAYDLRFLSLLPNLEELHMAMVDVQQAPDLSDLEQLGVVWANECRLGDLGWLADSRANKMQIRSHADFATLGQSEFLRVAILDSYQDTPTDFSVFSPPQLREFDLCCWDMDEIDLSGLAACEKLRQVRLSGCPAENLDFLSGQTGLTLLQLRYMPRLRDISALSELTQLRELLMEDCNQLRDLSPIAGCTALVDFNIACDDALRLRDVSFLGNLPKLNDISLGGVELPNLDFLVSLSESHTSLNSFGFWGSIGDYSGLSAIKQYGSLSIDPDDGARLEEILPYLENAAIQDLQLRRFKEVNLSTLPHPSVRLELDRCGITDLSALPEDWKASHLNLNKCSSLQSLDGLQNQSRIKDLEVYLCPRLTDWSALEGMNFSSLSITGGFTVPEGVAFRTGMLRLDSVAEVNALSILDSLDAEKSCSFELVGLEDLNNLQPLSRFHGTYLAVSPQLAEQAEDLVDAGNFREYRIEYPEGGWEMDEMEYALLSLDELDTLPPALLRRITSVCIAGDQVIDLDRYDIWEDWEHKDGNGNPALQLHDRETDEVMPLSPGVFEDMERLGALTGLRELYLYGQPLQSLDGIQMLASLEIISAMGCSTLTDASALFALPELRWVDLKCTQLDSIQGVQNLWGLRSLNVSNTKVDDLTPLAESDFSAAEEDGGFDLDCNELDLSEEDFAAMAHIRRFQGLAFTDADPAIWIPALSDCEIQYFGAAGDLHCNEDLAAFAADHPELRALFLGWAENITDLTPLLELENLERVSVNRDMREAVASLDGQSYGFELEIQG